MIWHSEPLEHVLQELKTDKSAGLDQQEADLRRRAYGENKRENRPGRTVFQRFLARFKTAAAVILMIAAAVSFGTAVYQTAAGERADWLEPVVIALIPAAGGLLGAFREHRAEAALEAMEAMAAPSAHVWRNGSLRTAKPSELVPGDILDLEAGDRIPADCRLLETAAFQCDESPLTGESAPVEKHAEAVCGHLAPLGSRRNMAYADCAVTHGRARAAVVETGMTTEMGKIASMRGSGGTPAAPLQIRLARLEKVAGALVLAVCLIVLLLGLAGGGNPLPVLLVAASLAVAAMPERLTATAAVVLAAGVQRLAAKNAIIRRLPAVETLGSASVICSDKTGTLTQNRMTLTKVYDGRKLLSFSGDAPESAAALLRLATLCTDGDMPAGGAEKRSGDPTEAAIISAAREIGLYKETMESEFPRLGEIPFDPERKRMTTVHMIHGHTVAIVKGAPGVLFQRCLWKSPELRAAAENAGEEMGREALRVLAVGYKSLDKIPVEYRPEELEDGLLFAGLLGMADPPRPEAAGAVRECAAAGIRTVMITGDHVVTASAVAKELGILKDGEEAITGSALAGLSDNELYQNIRRYRVYARVAPPDKLRIVNAWQKAGEVVAVTGDGVGDAPALKAADIGCAMGTGTDVAKGASDMVLTDDNFATIAAAVREGRGIYDNIRKTVRFLLSCGLGGLFAVLFAMIFWRESPLLPVQLLWIGLVIDSFPAAALGREPAESDAMRRKPRPQKENFFADGLGTALALEGVMIGLLSLAAYGVGSRVFTLPGGAVNQAAGQSMAFATLAISQLVHALNVRSPHSLFRAGFLTNRAMLGAFGVSLLLMLAVLAVPPLHGIFGVSALTAREWGVVAALSLAPLPLAEAAKAVAAFARTKGNRP